MHLNKTKLSNQLLVDVVQLYLELILPFITVDVSIWWKIYYIWAIYVSLYLPALNEKKITNQIPNTKKPKKTCSAMSSQTSNENSTSKENNLHVGSPSPRKKRNNSTPTRKNAAEKKQILQQLISPNTNNKVSKNFDRCRNDLRRASHFIAIWNSEQLNFFTLVFSLCWCEYLACTSSSNQIFRNIKIHAMTSHEFFENNFRIDF